MQTRDETLQALAILYDFDMDELIDYADEATDIGGYHPNGAIAKWPVGSMWAVEGQIIYALIRATRPAVCIETGTNFGCSATHITAALEKNRKGKLICVDWSFDKILIPEPLRARIEFHQGDIYEFAANMPPFDFLLEDGSHDTDQVKAVWTAGLKAGNPGAFILSHDAEHYIVGLRVKRGIIAAGAHDTHTFAIEPSDCGLGVFRLPMADVIPYDLRLRSTGLPPTPETETDPVQAVKDYAVIDKEASRKAENARKARERRAAKKAGAK